MPKSIRTALVLIIVLCGVLPDATAQGPAFALTILGSGGPRAAGRAASGSFSPFDSPISG